VRRFESAIACVSVAVLLACLPAATASAGAPAERRGRPATGENNSTPIRQGARFEPGQVLVKFKPGAGTGAQDSIRREVGASSSEPVGSTGIELMDIGGADVRAAVEELRACPAVEYAEPDYVRSVGFNPDDPYYSSASNYQWNMKNPPGSGGIDMPNAWDLETGSTSIVVAILDTGVAYRTGGGYTQAPDLAGTSFVQGYDFINNDPYADDDHGHGTHVCGTVAQTTNNALGCAGVAFGTRVMPVKVLNSDGIGNDSELINGIAFAADHGAEVINMSLGGPDHSAALQDACNYAALKDVVICAAAGNADIEAVEYPAAYPACVAVGATNKAKARASYSNFGAELDVVAPGGDSTSQIYQQTFKREGQPSSGFAYKGKTGTSMATPHVSGLAALVRAHQATWTAAETRAAIASSCYDLGAAGWDAQFGWGLIDATAALNSARPALTTPDVVSISPAFGAEGSTVDVAVRGSGFTSKAKVILERESEPGLSGSSFSVAGGKITCHLSLDGGQPGLWSVTVENSNLQWGGLTGGFSVDNANNRTWYMAEGSTSYGFEEYILVQNPNSATAGVTLTLMGPDGALPPYSAQVAGNSRLTINVNGIAPDTDVSARVTSDQDIICERSMYWNNRIEGTDSIGVQSPSYTWYLAEGSTNYGYETFVLVQNPTTRRANVTVTYMTTSGPVQKPTFAVDANSRYSINVADDLPAEDMSFKVVADQRVIAERSMYWSGRRGGHDSVGTVMPSEKWFMAEGSTDWGYTEYILIQNPNDVTAHVTLTYMTPAGPVPQPAMTVPAGSRKTVRVNDALPSKDVSVQVVADRGVVAERSMYWDNGTGQGGHNAIGVPQARRQCFLAEGSTNWGFSEWILVQNPNPTPASIGINYMTASGLRPKNAFVLAANSRVTVNVNNDVPGVDTSAQVFSNLPVIAERSMYWNSNGGGHVSTGLMK
jgi:serine protease